MKGFIGGIPIALLAVAAQAKLVEREHGFPPTQNGGTAMGGPSGDDSDGGFISPYSASIKTNTQVNEWNKDDHSINVKHKDVYPRPHHAPAVFGPPVVEGPQVPGMGPFGKRSTPGGTAMGGPSGNDEGQSFDMPITGIFNTEVNDYNQDDHSIDVKNTHVHPPPVAAVQPPVHFVFNTPPEAFEKRFHPQEGGTAMGGPGGGSHYSHGPEGFPRPHGGVAMGGPSGNDGGLEFSKPVTGHFHTNVNEFNEDDHSIDLKHKDEYLPEPVAPAFLSLRRSFQAWMGACAGWHRDGWSLRRRWCVNEHNEDNHSIHSSHEDVYPAPHVVPGPHYGGPGPVIFNSPANHGPPIPAQHGPPHHSGPPHGPPFGGPPHGHPDVFAPHTDIYAPKTYAPSEDIDLTSIKQLNNGPSAGGVGPFNRRSTDLPLRTLSTALLARLLARLLVPLLTLSTSLVPPPPPQVYAPYTAVYAPETYAPEEDFDLESIQQINNGPSAGGVGPFNRRAFSPSREAGGGGGGTAMGGPSGDDEGAGFSDPTDIDVTTGVNEHNEDNHAIKGDFTHVHHPNTVYNADPYQYESPAAPAEYPESESYPAPPAHSFEAPPSAEVPESQASPPSPPSFTPEEESTPPSEESAPPSEESASPSEESAPPSEESAPPSEESAPPSEDHEQDSKCSAQVHEVVRTVTKTQYKTAEATRLVDPKIKSYAASASAHASPEAGNFGYNYASQRPLSQAASFSMIPVHVPMATPSSAGAYSMATPSGTHGLNMPTDVSAEHKASPSSSAWASASHGVMFQGAAPRLSGGIVSVAAAVMGVLAFII
ncbi:uncharacterized protein N7529_005787 [Penicillium soppii]|uniref:uncharacterized protein n=1 Tax=Penicillium soppii TaxID=69789 RepID=UPI0025494649|nr:uncharacterized protein N7529_005787 [Penicillium soppii]KAJ5863871.1 hypothetical protein N7529_005787 [Penicillium soppii]